VCCVSCFVCVIADRLLHKQEELTDTKDGVTEMTFDKFKSINVHEAK